MLEESRLRIVFFWHWQKRLSGVHPRVFAVFDSLIYAISRLSEDYDVKLLAICNSEDYEVFSKAQNIHYIFRRNIKKLIDVLMLINPDIFLLNHHPSDYTDLMKKIDTLKARKYIYYSAPIKYLSHFHLKMDGHMVHHGYQKKILETKGVNPEKIFVAPKTANMDVFKPDAVKKRWDCIYPMRGDIGYWKRPELAIEACRVNDMTIVMPGAKIPPEYFWVTTFEDWKNSEELSILYNQSKCLVVTSNNAEMGPRIIPEAASCNIPIVCCSDNPAAVSHIKKIGGYIAKPEPEDIANEIKIAVSKKVDTRQKLIELGYDYSLIYRTFIDILKIKKENQIETQGENLLQRWNRKYKTELIKNENRWKSQWRMDLYEWVLEDIEDNICSIIDIGSGPGYGLERIKKHRPHADVLAVDYSIEAIKQSVVPAIQKDILRDDLSSLSADYALCINTMEHFEKPYFVLDRIIAISKKKAILTVPYKEDISNHTEHEYVFSKKTFKKYNIDRIVVKKRGLGKIMKVVINPSNEPKENKYSITSILRKIPRAIYEKNISSLWK